MPGCKVGGDQQCEQSAAFDLEHHVLSHCTIAPFVVDPGLIKQLSDTLLPKSPIHMASISRHPQKKVLSPLAGLETGSVRMAKKIMPSKAVPFSIEDWPGEREPFSADAC